MSPLPQSRSRASWRSLSGAVALVLAAALLAAAADAPVIRAIDIHTSGGLTRERVLAQMRVRVGDLYRPEIVSAEIGRLWRLGHLRDVRIDHEPLDNGVKLVVTVAGWPRIVAISWEGDFSGSHGDLAEMIVNRKGDYARGYLLDADRRAIEDALKHDGYPFASVRQRLIEAEGGLRVIYEVDAGPGVRVEAVAFDGNRAFTADRLRKLLITSPPGLFKEATSYNPVAFQADLDAVAALYRSEGWLDATVGHRLDYDETRQHLFPMVRIREGSRYRIENVEVVFSGDRPVHKRERILAVMHSVAGGHVRQEDLDRDRRAVYDLYGAVGRIGTRVALDPAYAATGSGVRLRVLVNVGPIVQIERVDIRGNTFTQDHVIRRDVTLIPGHVANSLELEKTRSKLLNTGLFAGDREAPMDAAVRVRFVEGSAPDRVVVLVEVQEGPKGELTFGVNYGSATGLSGMIGLTHNNFDFSDLPKSVGDFFRGDAFVGGGQTLSLRATPGTTQRNYVLDWSNPSVNDSPWSLGFGGHIREYVGRDWDEKRRGISGGVGRALASHLRGRVDASWERLEIDDVDAGAPADAMAAAGKYTRQAITVALMSEHRDNRFFPSEGYFVKGSVALVGTGLGGDIDVVQESLEGHWYATVWEPRNWGKHVLHIGGEISAVQATKGGDVPIFERYNAGGHGTVRGFDFRGIGPVDATTGDHIGGEIRAVANVEYEVPIYSHIFRGVAFFDVGKVGKEMCDLDGTNLSAAVGVGIRIRVLGGAASVPISLELGFPVIKQDNDDTRTFSFNMGTGFEF